MIGLACERANMLGASGPAFCNVSQCAKDAATASRSTNRSIVSIPILSGLDHATRGYDFRKEQCSLFIVGQICASPLCHDHHQGAIRHIHPIAPTNKLVRTVPHEWTIGITAEVRIVKAVHSRLLFNQNASSRPVPLGYRFRQ
jgi:hypothetical protein